MALESMVDVVEVILPGLLVMGIHQNIRKLVFNSLFALLGALLLGGAFVLSCAGEPDRAVPTLTVKNQDATPPIIEHIVLAGETLSYIAWQYGCTVDELMNANNIENANVIEIGQVIVIPRGIDTGYPTTPSTPWPVSTPPVAATSADNAGSDGEVPTRLIIPKINLDTPVVEVGWQITWEDGQPVRAWDVADFAAGWHGNSALPGTEGNIILSGHHNIKGEVFRYLVDLDAGDEVSLFCGDRAFTYQVTEKYIIPEKGMPASVRDANALWLAKTPEERLTMVTCWPYTNNTHRVIIVAKPTRE